MFDDSFKNLEWYFVYRFYEQGVFQFLNVVLKTTYNALIVPKNNVPLSVDGKYVIYYLINVDYG